MKFIRIEDVTGTGVYRSDVSYQQVDYSNFLYVIGLLTHAPTDNMIFSYMKKFSSYPKLVRGFVPHMEKNPDAKFVYNIEFFKRIASNELTADERDFLKEFRKKMFERVEFETPDQSFIEQMFDAGLNVYIVETDQQYWGTDQQSLIDPKKATFTQVFSIDELMSC